MGNALVDQRVLLLAYWLTFVISTDLGAHEHSQIVQLDICIDIPEPSNFNWHWYPIL